MSPEDRKHDEDYINEILRLGFECNEDCVFCNFIPETEPDAKRLSTEEAKSVIRRISTTTQKELSISGGEPTLRKDLIELIAFARECGIKQVQIQTNAVLITPDYARRLAEAGLTDAFVAFHSHIPEIQDALTGLPGSCEKTIEGTRNCIAAGISTAVNIVITTRNVETFPEFVDFVAETFPGLCHLSMAIIQPHGRARDRLELLPRYSDIAGLIWDGLARAEGRGLRIDNHYCSLPLCFWDPALIAETLEFKESTHLRGRNRGEEVFERIRMVMRDKYQGPDCRNCWVKNFCFGVWTEYIDRHGFADIRPSFYSLKYWG